MRGLSWIEEGTRRNDTHRTKCIEFRPRLPDDRNWLKVIRGDGCFSKVGRDLTAGGQVLSIGVGCATPSVVAHEHIQALGIH